MTKVFIDGSAGTTGLRIYERLGSRQDIELMILTGDLRKDPAARADMLNTADIAFLCLPDQAAREAVELVTSPHTAIIDTSTAHRTNDGWAYGFPELTGKRAAVANSKRIANPGCHASGFIALVAPLVEQGLLKADVRLSCFSLTGYSGGGKKMIADYESDDRSPLLKGPRQYGLTQVHKHLPEMVKLCGLEVAPAFCPVVGDFYSGMEVTVPVFASDLKGGIEDIKALYKRYYSTGLVKFQEEADPDGMLSAAAFSGRDDMAVSVYGNDDRIILVSRFDNLGKGASGAAIQNMNILLGIDESTGLNV
ncbi:MAG: N-acetyl-gamma-glutamyl-phosphate reductase [Oscillospiraceae bacterium]|nr:N-acetyl-gamma-glutamyl-phosphate reductase [Oscillospiraceae bacterium]